MLAIVWNYITLSLLTELFTSTVTNMVKKLDHLFKKRVRAGAISIMTSITVNSLIVRATYSLTFAVIVGF